MHHVIGSDHEGSEDARPHRPPAHALFSTSASFFLFSSPSASSSLLSCTLTWPSLRCISVTANYPCVRQSPPLWSGHDQDTCTRWAGIHRGTVSPAWRLLWDDYTEIHIGCQIRQCHGVLHVCVCVRVFDIVPLCVRIRGLYLWTPCNTNRTWSWGSPGAPLIRLYSQRTNSSSMSHYRGTPVQTPTAWLRAVSDQSCMTQCVSDCVAPVAIAHPLL